MAACEVFKNFSLRELNTWGSGGRCLWLASPRSAGEAAAFARSGAASEGAVYVLGGGSNVLVQDGLLEAGVVSCAHMTGIKLTEARGFAEAEIEAGFPVKKLLALAVEKNLGGFEFLAGIPGTVGGALCGNAGAGGVSFAPLVERIETVSNRGEIRLWETGELSWSYRASPWGGEAPFMITRAFLRIPFSSKDNIINNIRHYSSLKKGQPIGAKTAGWAASSKIRRRLPRGCFSTSAAARGFPSETLPSPSTTRILSKTAAARRRQKFSASRRCAARASWTSSG